jgi:two-component system, LuxR family, sensor kinase FixL
MADRSVTEAPRGSHTDPLPAALLSDLRATALVGVAYYVGCLIGFALRFPASGIAFIWPPTAILLASLLILDRRRWPIILAATFVAHGIAHTQDHLPVLTWLCQFGANALQAVLAAHVVRRFSDPPFRCDTLRSVTALIGGAAIAAPAIASLVVAAVYVKMGWAADFWTAWGMRTLTNAVTTTALVPPLTVFFGEHRRLLSAVTFGRAAEFAFLLLGLAVVDMLLGSAARSAAGGVPLSLYACMPFLVWAAVRFGIPGLSICVLAMAYLTIEPPGGPLIASAGLHAAREIVGIQLFIGIAASPLMFLAVLLQESRQARVTEEALYHSEAKNAAILRAIPDLMFVQTTQPDHRYLDYYAFDRNQLLAAPETFLGKPMREVLPPDLARSFSELFQRAIASGEPEVMEYALPIGGDEHVYEARVVACDDDRLLSIVRDITERKRAETALQKAEQSIVRISRASALGELAASIAHEVQQPLSAILTNAAASLRMIEQDASHSEQLADALTDIAEDSRRASQVIKRTRELFSGGRRENAPVELNSTIAEVLALTRHRAARTGESIRAELAGGALVVMGDRVQLQQVLLNLVMNGLEAMRHETGPNRTVVVSSWRDEEGHVHVSVRDAGEGFDPADSDRIFDPFYTTKADGLGIGLAVSRSIVQAHGGRLTATLNATGGATFAFHLPAARDTPQ